VQIVFVNFAPGRNIPGEGGDLDRKRKLLTIRDRKDPREKKGNDQSIPLLDVFGYSALEFIQDFSTVGKYADRIFPYIQNLSA